MIWRSTRIGLAVMVAGWLSLFVSAQTRKIPGLAPGAQQSVPSSFNQRTTSKEDVAQAKVNEQLGNLEQAVTLYERALLKEPGNGSALAALPPLYLQLQQFDRAITILAEQVNRTPSAIPLRRQLADALFQAKRLDEARQQCSLLIGLQRKDEGTIHMVASLYANYGQITDAARTYLDGREAIGKPNMFAQPLSELYTTMSDLAGAVNEYTRWLNAQPAQFTTIDDNIDVLARSQTPEALEQALLKAGATNSSNRLLHKLIGNFYLRWNKPAEAFAQYRKADQLDGAKGVYLLEFATWATREEDFPEAIQAYKEVGGASFPRSTQAQAAVGLAMVYEATDRDDDALSLYQEVLSRFPRTRQSEEALFRSGEIHLTYRHDPQAALSSFRLLLSSAPETPFRQETLFRIADCHLSNGSIRDAIDQYNQILNPAPGSQDETNQTRAKFNLAEMDMFRGQIEEAKKQFSAIASAYPGSPYANDALQWGLLLGDESSIGEDVIQSYVQAILLRRQFKAEASLDAYKVLFSSFPDSPIADLAVLAIGGLLNELNKPYEAIAAFNDLINRYPDSKYTVDAQLHIAEVYEIRLKDTSKAITAYETVLVNFPDYFMNDSIRRKISQLTAAHPAIP